MQHQHAPLPYRPAPPQGLEHAHRVDDFSVAQAFGGVQGGSEAFIPPLFNAFRKLAR